jgi:hypothetical protein
MGKTGPAELDGGFGITTRCRFITEIGRATQLAAWREGTDGDFTSQIVKRKIRSVLGNERKKKTSNERHDQNDRRESTTGAVN